MVPNKCLGCYRVTTKSPEKNVKINFDIKINFDLVIAEGPSVFNLFFYFLPEIAVLCH